MFQQAFAFSIGHEPEGIPGIDICRKAINDYYDGQYNPPSRYYIISDMEPPQAPLVYYPPAPPNRIIWPSFTKHLAVFALQYSWTFTNTNWHTNQQPLIYTCTRYISGFLKSCTSRAHSCAPSFQASSVATNCTASHAPFSHASSRATTRTSSCAPSSQLDTIVTSTPRRRVKKYFLSAMNEQYLKAHFELSNEQIDRLALAIEAIGNRTRPAMFAISARLLDLGFNNVQAVFFIEWVFNYILRVE